MIDQAQTDVRYRMLVHLRRSDQPTHWVFHCPKCTMALADIVNSHVSALTDLIDEGALTTTVSVACKGRTPAGKCHWLYYFNVGGEA